MKIDKWIIKEHNEGVPNVDKIYKKVTVEQEISLQDDEM